MGKILSMLLIVTVAKAQTDTLIGPDDIKCKKEVTNYMKEFGIKSNLKHVKTEDYKKTFPGFKKYQDAYEDAHNKKRFFKAQLNSKRPPQEMKALSETMAAAEAGFQAEIKKLCQKDTFHCKRFKDTHVYDSAILFSVQTFEDIEAKNSAAKEEDPSFMRALRESTKASNNSLRDISKKLIKDSQAVIDNPNSTHEMRVEARRALASAQANIYLASTKSASDRFSADDNSSSPAYKRVKLYRSDADSKRIHFFTVSTSDNPQAPDLAVYMKEDCSISRVDIDGIMLNKATCKQDEYAIGSEYKRIGCRNIASEEDPETNKNSDFRPYLTQPK